jgi:hypothetical protein
VDLFAFFWALLLSPAASTKKLPDSVYTVLAYDHYHIGASRHPTLRVSNPTVSDLSTQGYQLLGTISQTKVDVMLNENPQGKPSVEAIVNSHLVVLETCVIASKLYSQFTRRSLQVS